MDTKRLASDTKVMVQFLYKPRKHSHCSVSHLHHTASIPAPLSDLDQSSQPSIPRTQKEKDEQTMIENKSVFLNTEGP